MQKKQKCNNKDCHRKSVEKKKIPGSGGVGWVLAEEMFGIKSILRGREREETKSCPLLSCWVGKEGRGPQLHHRQLLLYKASFVLLHPDSFNGSSIFEIWVLQELYFFELLYTFS